MEGATLAAWWTVLLHCEGWTSVQRAICTLSVLHNEALDSKRDGLSQLLQSRHDLLLQLSWAAESFRTLDSTLVGLKADL